MSQSSLFQTDTAVDTAAEMGFQRRQAFARDRGILTGLSIFAQMLVGCGLYLFSHVSTPGYLSILMTGPVIFLIALLSLHLQKRCGEGDALALPGKWPGRALALLLSLVFFLDAQLAAYGISAILSDVLPHFSPLLTMLTVALMLALALGGEEARALSRLSRLLRWPILAALLICGLAALLHGSPGYLFPVLGEGLPSIFRGALWMSGCAAGACCPMVLPGNERPSSLLPGRGRIMKPLAFFLLLGILYALLCACMLPFYALARPENLGFRLLLYTKISGSALSWSLMLFALLFLLLIALSAGVQRSAALIAFAAGKKRPGRGLIMFLLLLLVPASALKSLPVQQILLDLAPFRAAVVLGVLLLLWMLLLGKGKKASA